MAGMDDYLSKPLRPQKLLDVIDNVLTRTALLPVRLLDSALANSAQPVNAVRQDRVVHNDSSVIDFSSLLERVEQDNTLATEMIESYLQIAPHLLEEITTGVERCDAVAIQRAAHSLKGALQNLSAIASADAATRLEESGQSGALESIDEDLESLQNELHRLQLELTEWRRQINEEPLLL